MSTPWVVAFGVPDRWAGAYVHFDGEPEAVLDALEGAFVRRGGDLHAALAALLAPPLGWRILDAEPWDPGDEGQAAWIGTGRPEPGLGPADVASLERTALWAIVDPETGRGWLSHPGGDVLRTFEVASDGYLVGRQARPPSPAARSVLERAAAAWPGGDFEAREDEVIRWWVIVETVQDPARERTLAEAHRIDPWFSVGDSLGELVTEADLP